MKLASIKLGNQRLLRLAGYIERRQRALPKRGYDQSIVHHNCGAPACAIGHGEALYPQLRKGDTNSFFRIDNTEWRELFAFDGCGNAHTDWRKAVAYIRDFVARRGGAK